MAHENVSRPQPWPHDIGVRNWPSAERGPNAIGEITQPPAISTSGVRHGASFDGAGAVVDDMGSPGSPAPDSARGRAAYLGARSYRPKRKFVMGSICSRHGCMAVPPQGTGADPDEVLYDLLEVRITGLEMPAQCRMF